MELNQLRVDYQRVIDTQANDERQTVNAYMSCLDALAVQYDIARSQPPRPLTIPAIFHRSRHENTVSDYLAYVLDPQQNGIGEAPLAQLLQLCDVDATDLPLAEATVYREYTLGNGRIDLLIEWEDAFVLGIEVKVFSPEGPDQTPSYAREMRKAFEDTPHHLVFLTRGGQKPRSKRFQPLSYQQLLEAFHKVQLPEEISARQAVLWADFLEHVEVYVAMSEPDHFEFSERTALYLDHYEMIEDLRSAFRSEWNKAIDYIEHQVYAQLDGGPWETRFTGGQYGWRQVFKTSWHQPGLSVRCDYHFSESRFRRGELTFSVDVEGSRAIDFLSLFDQRYPALEDTYNVQGIVYRPPKMRGAIAWKTYRTTHDIEQVAEVFVNVLREHRFLVPEIDTVLEEMGSQ